MVRSHLKRINAPKSWPIRRKKEIFIKRPFSSGHALDKSIPLLVIFRDMLKKVKTRRELNYIIENKGIYLNDKKVRCSKNAAGLMDVISIPETKEYFRILINNRGLLEIISIDENEAKINPLMIRSKTKIRNGKTQINFTNGHNMIVDKDEYKTGDVLVYDFMNKKIKEHLKLEKGTLVYFTRGRYTGRVAQIEEIKEDMIIYKKDGETFETPKSTSKDYTFFIGKESPIIKLAD